MDVNIAAFTTIRRARSAVREEAAAGGDCVWVCFSVVMKAGVCEGGFVLLVLIARL